MQSGLLVDALATRHSVAADNGDVAVVRSLLQQAKIPLARVQDIRRVTAKSAFCNALYRVTMAQPTTTPDDGIAPQSSYMAKVFSLLAASRMRSPWMSDGHENTHNDNEESLLFRMDKLAAEHDLGPKIFATIDTASSPALLMQDCPGNPMTELDLQENKTIVYLAGEALAKLHSLTPTLQVSTSNMLWQSCHVLMQQYADPQWKVDDDDRRPWTYDRLF